MRSAESRVCSVNGEYSIEWGWNMLPRIEKRCNIPCLLRGTTTHFLSPRRTAFDSFP